MTRAEMIWMWEGIFASVKGLAYLLAMACMIKYLMA
jgi:hypothetical protein